MPFFGFVRLTQIFAFGLTKTYGPRQSSNLWKKLFIIRDIRSLSVVQKDGKQFKKDNLDDNAGSRLPTRASCSEVLEWGKIVEIPRSVVLSVISDARKPKASSGNIYLLSICLKKASRWRASRSTFQESSIHGHELMTSKVSEALRSIKKDTFKLLFTNLSHSLMFSETYIQRHFFLIVCRD